MNSLRYICMMAILRRIFDFYINSSMHVAFAVCAFTAISSDVLKITISVDLLCFIFFGTITGYNFVKYAGIAKFHYYSLKDSLRIIQVFSLFCLAICVYFAVRLPFKIFIACLPLGLLTLFYAVPIAPKKNNLRTLPTLKIFVIAAVWAGTTVYLPTVYDGLQLNWEIWVLLVQRFLLVLALILPFEIRDVAYDDIELGTFPQMLGVKSTKFLGYLLLLIYLALNLFDPDQTLEKELVTYILALTAALAIYFARINQDQYYSSFWVEGIPIFSWLSYTLIQTVLYG